MGRGDVKVDGESVACPLPTDATLASAFVYLRDHILREGKIVTDVRIDDDPVTWEDGSPGWSELLSSDHELSIASDFPIRITSPLLTRLVETLPTVAAKHREFAGKLREQDPTASEGMADLLGVWQDLQQALDQVCQLHGPRAGRGTLERGRRGISKPIRSTIADATGVEGVSRAS